MKPKARPPMNFAPENKLEEALIAASSDPAARPLFYRLLLSSKLYVINEEPPPNHQNDPVKSLTRDDPGKSLTREKKSPTTLKTGTPLEIRSIDIDDVAHVPVFSSPLRISQVVEKDVHYLEATGKALLEIVGSDHVILNPGLEYGKLLAPEEIAALLDGSIFEHITNETKPTSRKAKSKK